MLMENIVLKFAMYISLIMQITVARGKIIEYLV